MCTDRIRAGLTALLFVAALLFAGSLHGQGISRTGGVSYIGVGLVNISADRANTLKLGEPRGVEVGKVTENSPAQTAGIQVGDVLLAYNSEEILSPEQLGRLVRETPAGRKVKLEYWRDGKAKSTIIVPAADNTLGPDQSSAAANFQSVSAPNIPRMLIVWDNLVFGIEFEPVDSQLAQYFGVTGGILVRDVGRGLRGEKAGLKAGDVITAIDTRTISSPRDLISYTRTEHVPGKTVIIKIFRDRKPRTLTVPPNE